MGHVVDYALEFIIFDSVVLSGESYKLVIVGGTIEIRDMRYHLKATVEFISCKSLFDGITNSRYYNISSLFERILLFG